MTTLGWGNMIRHVRGTTNIPERMRVLEGEDARTARGQDSKDPVVTRVVIYSSDVGRFNSYSVQAYDDWYKIKKDESGTPF